MNFLLVSDLKRVPVKYIRDFIKRDYKLKDYCHICRATVNLELHHIYSLSELFQDWCKKNNIGKIITVKQITELRIRFKKDHSKELSNHNLYTLCKIHHQRLHNLYGQIYPNYLVPKIEDWLNIQRKKYN